MENRIKEIVEKQRGNSVDGHIRIMAEVSQFLCENLNFPMSHMERAFVAAALGGIYEAVKNTVIEDLHPLIELGKKASAASTISINMTAMKSAGDQNDEQG